ncbi:MAG: hypothetical protein AAF514_23730, partial [Verrucomicrobiota bacterium]
DQLLPIENLKRGFVFAGGLSMAMLLWLGWYLTRVPDPAQWRSDAVPWLSTPDGFRISYLGNPMAADRKKGRARNVWDLQRFDQRLFLGGGDTMVNGGTVNVWAFDPAESRFIREFHVDEEAIEVFRVLENRLFIPASDPRNRDESKFYHRPRRTGGTETPAWTAVYDPLPLAHVRDLAFFHNRLIGVGNSRTPPTMGGAFVSRDFGKSLRLAVPEDPTTPYKWADHWHFSVFEYEDILFSPTIRLSPVADLPSIATYDLDKEAFAVNSDFSTSDFLPVTRKGEPRRFTLRLWLPISFHGHLIYPAKTYAISEEFYNRSYGCFTKKGLREKAVETSFPHPGVVGEDVVVEVGVMYALTNLPEMNRSHRIAVYAAQPPSEGELEWELVFEFTATNKGRSFEKMGADFYIGLGHEHDEPTNHSGALLKVSQWPE